MQTHTEEIILFVWLTSIINPSVAALFYIYIHGLTVLVLVPKKPPISNIREQAISVHVPLWGVNCIRFSWCAVLGGTFRNGKAMNSSAFILFIPLWKTYTLSYAFWHYQHFLFKASMPTTLRLMEYTIKLYHQQIKLWKWHIKTQVLIPILVI